MAATIFLRPLVGGWVSTSAVLGLATLLASARGQSGLRRSPAATPGV